MFQLLRLLYTVVLTGCVSPGIVENIQADKMYIVVPDTTGCEHLGKVRQDIAPNTFKVEQAPLSAVFALKKKARLKIENGNVLSKIRMTDREFPLSEAEVCKCPEDVISKFKPRQADNDFIYSNITFDLPDPRK